MRSSSGRKQPEFVPRGIELVGVAVPFGTSGWTRDGWCRFEPGAFAAAIAVPKSSSGIEVWLDHKPGLVLARRADGDITLIEMGEGLLFHARVDDEGKADVLRFIAGKGQLHGVSVGWSSRRSHRIGDTE